MLFQCQPSAQDKRALEAQIAYVSKRIKHQRKLMPQVESLNASAEYVRTQTEALTSAADALRNSIALATDICKF